MDSPFLLRPSALPLNLIAPFVNPKAPSYAAPMINTAKQQFDQYFHLIKSIFTFLSSEISTRKFLVFLAELLM